MPGPVWERLGDPLVMEKGLRNRVIETWHTRTLPYATLTGDDIIDTCPPQYGHAHPDPAFPGAIVRMKRLRMGPVKLLTGDYSAAKVEVEYDSWVRFNLGNYLARSQGEAGLAPFKVYIARNGVLSVRDFGSRAWAEKRITCFSGSFNPDKIQHTILQNTGCWYFFRTDSEQGLPEYSVTGDPPRDIGFPALLVGGYCEPNGNGLTKVVYKFRTTGEVLAYDATQLGSDIDLPALGYLQEYQVVPTAASNSGYTIIAAKVTNLYLKGDTLPTGNPYNPIP